MDVGTPRGMAAFVFYVRKAVRPQTAPFKTFGVTSPSVHIWRIVVVNVAEVAFGAAYRALSMCEGNTACGRTAERTGLCAPHAQAGDGHNRDIDELDFDDKLRVER